MSTTTSTSADLKALYATVEADHEDQGAKLALADALDEAGEPDLAHCWRWFVKRGIGPNQIAGMWGWGGYELSRVPNGRAGPLYNMAKRCGEVSSAKHDSYVAAVESISPLLAQIRDTYRL